MTACGAIPTYGFVDGMSAGEARLDALLELMIAQGAGGLTIVPDRNWNIKDPTEKAAKLTALHDAIALAERLDLPVLAGTEMNRPGQRELDDFAAPELRPFWPVFSGARRGYGGTPCCSGAAAVVIRARGRKAGCPRAARATPFTPRWVRPARPMMRGLASISAAAADGPEAVRAVLGL